MPVPADIILYLINLSLTFRVMYSFIRYFKTAFFGLAMAAITASSLTSCDAIYDDMDPCPEGAELRFIYEYNMEFYNTFPAQVTCLTVLVYDSEGNYITTRTVTDEDKLSDENWRMNIDLPAGDYKIIAYGGMACEDASFAFNPQPGAGVDMTSVGVNLIPSLLTEPVGHQLHPLFYGALDMTVLGDTPEYTAGTVKMMKDTNDFRIVLQNDNGKSLKGSDFLFTITDANTSFDWKNDLIPTEPVTYWAWYTGEGYTGLTDEANDWTTACAEISTSRLMENSDAHLTIRRASDGGEVFSVPLIRFLLMLKSEEPKFANMSPQEFLDRESRWRMVFFLDNSDGWLKIKIKINGWTVRLNDIAAGL